MRKRNTNKLLLLILFILAIITAIIIALYLNNNTNTEIDENQNQIAKQEKLKYDNGDVSYYDYSKGGLVDIDVEQYVKLPENYLEYQMTSNNSEEINAMLNTIVENSEVTIPNTLLNGYYGDIYNNAKAGAESEGKALDEYIKEVYGYDNYQKYIEENTEYFKEDIKKDLVYQAIAKDLNISISRNDVEEYFSERLENGDTYENLVELYGEKLMYKYTIQDKIEKALMQK